MRLLIQYKFFEPAFYHTETGRLGNGVIKFSAKLGDQAQVSVDLGHHPRGPMLSELWPIQSMNKSWVDISF